MKYPIKSILLFNCLAIIMLIGCKNNDKPVITILGENSSNIQAMQTLKDDYEKTHDTQLSFKPNSLEDALKKANQDLANKTGQYDIILQDNFALSSFVRNNYVYKLGELKSKSSISDYGYENDIFPNVWKEVGYYYENAANPDNNKVQQIAYPFAANTMLLVYNKELFDDPTQKKAYFEKYGEDLKVPSDMSSFAKVAAFFTQPKKNLYGVCLEGATGGWLYYEWCSFVQEFGGKVLDKNQGWKGNANTSVLITQPQVVEATNFYKSLKPYNAGNFVTTDGVEQRNILKKGNVAMALIWSDYMWGLIHDSNGKLDNRFAFEPTPGAKSFIAGGCFYINKQSKNPQAAFQYVQYLLQKNNQIKMIQQGLCSPLKSAYDAPEVQNVPYIHALKTSLLRADYMLEAAPDAVLINNVTTKYLQKIWNGEVDVQNGLEAAKKEIEQERIALFK